uniref:Amiloride-sensitive sodium channel n=1 Tax=Heterorhabditis bacteriophora TaxID=37862 RepID=A0A1I7XGY8_HETBA
MHGPKRIYKGKRFSTIFWLLMVTASGIFLIFQVFTLVSMYVSSPTVSQVSFLINENGMEFPMVTFECNEVMKMCSFGGRQFDCCKYMRPVLTNLGKCYSLDMKGSSKEWMHKQTSAGVNAGLQIILDAHMEEQFDGTVDGVDPIFSNAFENGYRYYVHAAETIPTLVSEGISVSTSTRVYSAITTNRYILLSSDHWGNCSEHWPNDYSTTLPYSSVNCDSLCKARYFNEKCRCTPFTYNIDGTFNLCSPYQTFQCIDQHIRRQINGELQRGCQQGPLGESTNCRSNFLTVNVFFRDMSHTEYTQVQATSLTEILSNIGGNMGMFLGMSLITVTEITLYISKICWIAFSKKRRDYMFEKRKNEVEREKQLEETVSSFNLLRGRKDGIKESSPSIRICTLEQLSENLRERDRNNQFCQTKEEPVERLGRIPSVISVPTVINSHEQYQQCGQIMNICDYKVLGGLKVTLIGMNTTHKNCQKFSIGFKSGEREGQYRVSRSLFFDWRGLWHYLVGK